MTRTPAAQRLPSPYPSDGPAAPGAVPGQDPAVALGTHEERLALRRAVTERLRSRRRNVFGVVVE